MTEAETDAAMRDGMRELERRGDLMVSRHTPGPWVVEEEQDDVLSIVQDEKRYPVPRHVAECFLPDADEADDDHTPFLEVAANARLIAAAPDLLAALQQVESEMRAGFGSSFGETRELVRRAIAKATQTNNAPGYMGNINGPGCDPDTP